MLFESFWAWLESTEIAIRIGESWWFPLLESIHVVAVTLVVGAILMVDLRLLGVAARRYTVSALASDLLPWAWAAFVLATLTGVGLFATRAYYYIGNLAFQAKLLLLLLAGINVAVFHMLIARNLDQWDQLAPPRAAKIASALSLLLWAGAMLAGRWIGHLSG